MKDTVRVAFIGAGGNASGHMQRVSEIAEARIAAICDVVGARAEDAASKFGARAYTDYRRMLDEEADLDAVYVSVPPFAHYDAEIRAAERGLHLFVEKPVAITLEKGIEVWEAIARNSVLSCVGYQVRYTPYIENVREFLVDKNMLMVTAQRWGSMAPTFWWRQMELSGGQLVEQTTHQIDLIRYWAGEVRNVYATYACKVYNNEPGVTIPDLQALQMEFANGAIGQVVTSCSGCPGGGGIEFFLEGMKLTAGASKPVLTPADAAPLDAEPREAESIDAVFVEAVRTGDGSKIKSPYLDALKSLDVTLAANRSAKERRPIATYFSW